MRALIAVGGAAWILALILAPLLPTPIAAFIYVFGSVICHQISDRSFDVAGAQLPVCARCVGMYAGFAASFAALNLRRVRARLCEWATGETRRLRLLAVASGVPTLATVGLEWTGFWQPSNFTRAGAGALLGGGLAVVVTCALASRSARVSSAREPSGLGAH